MQQDSGQEFDTLLTNFFDPQSERVLRYSMNAGLALTLVQRWIEDGGDCQLLLWSTGDVKVILHDPVKKENYVGDGHDTAIAICRAVVRAYGVPVQ